VKAAALLVAAALAGCGASQAGGDAGSDAGVLPPALKAQLDSAAATWAAARSSCAVYSYDRRFYSVFSSGTSTQVEVQNDTPTQRRFATFMGVTDADVTRTWMVVWDEIPPLVGYHDAQSGGYPASTVEQLLAACATVLARDPAQNTLSLETDGRGVPTSCTYRPTTGCVDDCTVGITVVSFDCAPLAN